MSLAVSKPSGALAPYIKQYWTVQNCLSKGQVYQHRIVPSGLVELSFYLGERPKMIKEEDEGTLDNSLITGQLVDFYDVEITGVLDLFSVTFQPQGAMIFFDMPLNELANHTFSAREVFDQPIQQIEERLFFANSFENRVRIIEDLLWEKLVRNQDRWGFDRIQGCMRLINKSFGNVTIDDLAGEACLGRKQFERVFNTSIGISPKQFLKVVRFQNAIYQKQINPEFNLTSLAHVCGYYDQSHMIADFKNLSGTVPSDFFAQCSPYSDYFSS